MSPDSIARRVVLVTKTGSEQHPPFTSSGSIKRGMPFVMKRAEANFTYHLSLMSDKEKAEFIEQGLAVLAALGL